MNHFILTYYNIHKLILAAFILAIKYNEDSFYKMNHYSKVGGVSLSELNNLVSEYLLLMKYNLFVDTKLYDKYNNDLMSLKYNDNDDSNENEEEYEEQEEEEEKEEKEEKEKQLKNNNNIYRDKNINQQNSKNEKHNYYNIINDENETIKT